jgi:hypothetical protein
LRDGLFPTALIENKALLQDSGKLSARLSRMLEAEVDEEEDRSRMRRALAYWGDRERADTTSVQNGDLAFAGVPQGVFTAFQLPWIGENEGTAPAKALLPLPPEPPPVLAPEPEPSRLLPPKGDQSIARPKPPTTEVPEPPSQRRPTKSELERLRAQLRTWADRGHLEDPSKWNRTLHELLRSIDSRRIGLDRFTFQRILTGERVKIEGTGPAQRSYFGVKPEEWVRDGFEAYVALSLDSKMSGDDAEFHRRNLALMMRRLEQLVSDYADRRLSLMPDGARWSPVTAIVQVLLGRAWLRGAAFADDPLPTQLRALLSDESEAEADPGARCAPWREFLAKTKDWHDRFRHGLREMIGTPQGDSRGFGLADVSLAAGAIQRLSATLRFDPVPGAGVDTGVVEFNKAARVMRSRLKRGGSARWSRRHS